MIKCKNKSHYKFYNSSVSNSYVYKLFFGTAFYIGATGHIAKRMQMHQYLINALLSKGDMSNRLYSLIIKHIQDNDIKEFTFIIYADCLNSKTAMILEDALIKKYINTPNCLNIGIAACGLNDNTPCKTLKILIDDELKAKIEKLAKKDSRKVTDWIRLQLIKIAK